MMDISPYIPVLVQPPQVVTRSPDLHPAHNHVRLAAHPPPLAWTRLLRESFLPPPQLLLLVHQNQQTSPPRREKDLLSAPSPSPSQNQRGRMGVWTEEYQDVTLSHLDEPTQVRGDQRLWFIERGRKKRGHKRQPCLFIWIMSRYHWISLRNLVQASLANLVELSSLCS